MQKAKVRSKKFDPKQFARQIDVLDIPDAPPLGRKELQKLSSELHRLKKRASKGDARDVAKYENFAKCFAEKLTYLVLGQVVNHQNQCYGVVEPKDLYVEGMIAVHNAVKKHDTGREVASYASAAIKNAIRQFLDKHNRTIRLPEHLIHKMFVKGPQNGTLPKGVDPYIYRQASQPPASLQQPLDDEGRTCLADTIPCSESESNTPRREYIEQAIDTLGKREADVIRKRYLCGISLGEVAKHYKVSKQRIKQIEQRAMSKLKNNPLSLFLLKRACSPDSSWVEVFYAQWNKKAITAKGNIHGKKQRIGVC